MVVWSANLVLAKIFLKISIFLGISFSSIVSILFNNTTNLLMNISAIIIHSAVCVCIPLLTSMTNNIISMIWAPPIIVLISDACPGQSTSVNWRYLLGSWCSIGWGMRVKKEEKPRSRVIPRSLDWGLLSREAVEATWVSTRQMEVLPESTCPSTPTLMFRQSGGLMLVSSSGEMSKSYFYISGG